MCLVSEKCLPNTGQDLQSARGETEPIREHPAEPELSADKAAQPTKSSSRLETDSGDSSLAFREGSASSLANRVGVATSLANGGGVATSLAVDVNELEDVRTDELVTVIGGPQTEERKNYAG